MALRKGGNSGAIISNDDEEEEDAENVQHRGLISALVNLVLRPIRPFLSRPAIRAYLTTILFVLLATILLGLAIAGYILFYWNYIPRIGFSRTIHLQFDHVLHQQPSPPTRTSTTINPYPHGTVTLTPDLISAQGYDITIELTLPHTPTNLDAGNFMLETKLYGPSSLLLPSATQSIATSRRPALLPYRSRLVRHLHTLLHLPYYLLSLRSESTTLLIPLFSSISFTTPVPSTLHLELQSTHTLQISSAAVHFRARFKGLRWVMYNHRILSAVFFISIFWMTELVAAGLAWGVVAVYTSSSSSKQDSVKAELKTEDTTTTAARIKQEPTTDDSHQPKLSDTERQFPTLSSQAPVRYSSPSLAIKQEPTDEVEVSEQVSRAAEADDEDEDEDYEFRDSGIGTSLESEFGGARRESVRKRRGRTEVKE